VSGGLIGGRIFWIRVLLLTHVGRKTGRTRLTPLLYIEDGDRWIVVASNAGDERYPAWWYNLQNRSETQIQVGRQRIDVRWRQATPDECFDLWPKLVESYRYFPDYQERSKREIPVVILERAAETAMSSQSVPGAEAIVP
jgi:deazaflavin-dependent oxidoreductase (nitroreductase family)